MNNEDSKWIYEDESLVPKNREEFSKWLRRGEWQTRKCDELARENEKLKKQLESKEDLEMETAAGTLGVYIWPNNEVPCVGVTFIPKNTGWKINLALFEVGCGNGDEFGGITNDGAEQDIVGYYYNDPVKENWTDKNVFRRSDIVDALEIDEVNGDGRYRVRGYLKDDYSGLMNSDTFDDFDKAINKMRDYAIGGNYTQIEDTFTGNTIELTPDQWEEAVEQGECPDGLIQFGLDTKEVA